MRKDNTRNWVWGILSQFIVLALLTGCAKSTRSLSNSSYREPGRAAHFAPRQNDSDPGFEYRGELSEFDVLGITRSETTTDANIEKALATARGGCETILCYWGILESANAKLVTKTVSWVPIADWFIPDETQHMRIRLKLALVDVRTGDWAVLSPNTIEDSKTSVSPRREVTDQKLVERLKLNAYKVGAKELVARYAEVASVQ